MIVHNAKAAAILGACIPGNLYDASQYQLYVTLYSYPLKVAELALVHTNAPLTLTPDQTQHVPFRSTQSDPVHSLTRADIYIVAQGHVLHKACVQYGPAAGDSCTW